MVAYLCCYDFYLFTLGVVRWERKENIVVIEQRLLVNLYREDVTLGNNLINRWSKVKLLQYFIAIHFNVLDSVQSVV